MNRISELKIRIKWSTIVIAFTKREMAQLIKYSAMKCRQNYSEKKLFSAIYSRDWTSNVLYTFYDLEQRCIMMVMKWQRRRTTIRCWYMLQCVIGRGIKQLTEHDGTTNPTTQPRNKIIIIGKIHTPDLMMITRFCVIYNGNVMGCVIWSFRHLTLSGVERFVLDMENNNLMKKIQTFLRS